MTAIAIEMIESTVAISDFCFEFSDGLSMLADRYKVCLLTRNELIISLAPYTKKSESTGFFRALFDAYSNSIFS